MNVSQVKFSNGKMIPASKFGKVDLSSEQLTLTSEEQAMHENLMVCDYCFVPLMLCVSLLL